MDIVHVGDVKNIRNQSVFFQDEKDWMRVKPRGKIVYQSQMETPDAGSICKETVTVTVDSKDVQQLLTGLEYYILRLFVNETMLLVGSLDYPAKKTYSDDKVRVSFTFTSTSPKN